MKAARVYAERLGWAVVPLHSAAGGVCSCAKGAECRSAGKHPRIPEWQNHATADATTIAGWVDRWPAGNVGIATGRASGFFVLDVDGAAGAATLEALLEQHGALPVTAEQRTGSGGTHYLFTLPDFEVRNSASEIGEGLDIRGDGGQIVVSPSVSAKGRYQWVRKPWDCAPAPAPAWLLELLRKPAPRAHAAPAAAFYSEELQFPPASAQVLAEARAALEQHGPAIEGHGGDEHTFTAAAMLRNDFALTEAEAWPVLVEWNETCQPPWSVDDLAAKMRGGAKYATRAFGCRRAVDTLIAARAMIAEWRAQPGDLQLAVTDLVARLRKLVSLAGDPTRAALIEREITGATGMKGRELALPRVTLQPERTEIPPGTIEVTTELHEVADKGTAAIAPQVFARAGVLCEVVRAERTFLSDLEPPRIVDLLSRHARWVRYDEKGTLPTTPPPAVAAIIHARRAHAGVRVIEAITTAPIFLADGEILQGRGYNAQARVFLEPNVDVSVPEEPTIADAHAAVDLFRDLLCDFRFASPADFSAWLAGLLSPLVKAATGNAPTPLFAISASNPGAGKSMLANLAALVITGTTAEVRTYNPRDPSEWTKRVTAYVRAASPISVFDNVNGAFGDEVIDRLVTSSTWSDRVLGASEAPPCPIVSTWWATGNNLEPIGDTVRRVLPIRIEVDRERPEERSDFKRKELEAYALEHRSDYLTAALTILRAFHCAGRPDQNLPAWGSFSAWSALVRGSLVWAGLADPWQTQHRAALACNETETEAHDFWLSVVEGSEGNAASIAALANARDAAAILGVREQITPFTLRKFLQRFVDRPRAGKRLRRENSGGAVTYYVETLATVAA